MEYKSKDDPSALAVGSVEAHTFAIHPPYCRMDAQALKQDYKLGLLTATGYLYYIIKISSEDGSSFAIEDANTFCEEWGMKRATFYKSRTECIALGLLTGQSRANDGIEKRVRDQLQQALGGLAEVATAVGRIDLLTDTEVIEVKRVDDWKSALGQVLAYGAFYPEHQKRIHLFGKVNPLKATAIESSCSGLNVAVTFGGEA